MEQFIWLPGNGIDMTAQNNLRSYFQCPTTPMGEAWFMGDERWMFDNLLGNLDHLSAYELQKPLEEIASGTSSFGPLDEWTAWYHYLLGKLLPRSHEYFVDSILEYLITGFMALYPNGIQHAPYPSFEKDVLLTLGRAMMDSYCWNDSEIIISRALHRSNNNPAHVWCWWDASGDFSSSMFFCIKYLPSHLIANWFKSVLEIPSPHWQAQLIVWLVGAHKILTNEVQWLSQLKTDDRPAISWAWSHCLKPELATTDRQGEIPAVALLPEASRLEVLRTVHECITESVFLQWQSSISQIPYLETELAEIPSSFAEFYLT